MSIKTFEELFEEVKKLYPNGRRKTEEFFDVKGYPTGREDKKGEFKDFEFSKRKTGSRYNFAIEVSFSFLKDPNKIYNVIKALKECE